MFAETAHPQLPLIWPGKQACICEDRAVVGDGFEKDYYVCIWYGLWIVMILYNVDQPLLTDRRSIRPSIYQARFPWKAYYHPLTNPRRGLTFRLLCRSFAVLQLVRLPSPLLYRDVSYCEDWGQYNLRLDIEDIWNPPGLPWFAWLTLKSNFSRW